MEHQNLFGIYLEEVGGLPHRLSDLVHKGLGLKEADLFHSDADHSQSAVELLAPVNGLSLLKMFQTEPGSVVSGLSILFSGGSGKYQHLNFP